MGHGTGAPTRSEPHQTGPTGPGTVVLDIGGDRGALVVHCDPDAEGREVEIRRVGEPWAGRHVAVRRRVVAGATFAAAVFGPLPGAGYEVRWRDRADADGQVVAVRAGSVREVALGRRAATRAGAVGGER